MSIPLGTFNRVLTPAGRMLALQSRVLVSAAYSGPWYSSSFVQASQRYFRTEDTHNGLPVYQGLADPEWFLVYSSVPVAKDDSSIPGTVVREPVSGPGDETVSCWKATNAPNVGSIVDGYSVNDLYRGTKIPVQLDSGVFLLGVVPGGDNPVDGSYFDTLSIGVGEVVFNGAAMALYTLSVCPDNGCDDCIPKVVGSLSDLLDFISEAQAACTADSLDLITYVVTETIDIDATAVSPAVFAINGYACCGEAP